MTDNAPTAAPVDRLVGRHLECWQCVGKGHLVITLAKGEETVTCARCSGHGYLVDDSPKTQAALADVDWLLIGSTDEYAELKRDIAIVCRDVVGFIDEICIHDIVATFRKHGFEVVAK